MKKRLILWDIDGTLVHSGPVGGDVFDFAIERVLGTRPTSRTEFGGKTDRQIAQEYLTLGGSDDPDHVSLVLLHLERELARHEDRMTAYGSACPGGEAVIRALAMIETVEQTVLTGNIAPNALAKLSAFGLNRFLDLEAGAYGDQHSDRRDLLPLAWHRQRDLRGRDYLPEETWVVGDTPRDLECAQASGAHCLLVATGRHDLARLTELSADFVIEDLSDTERVVSILTTGLPMS